MEKIWNMMTEVLKKIIGEDSAISITASAKGAWNGEEKLFKVFWVYGFVGGIIVALIGQFFHSILGVVGGLVSAFIQVPFFIWVSYSIWQCADNIEAETLLNLKRSYISLAARVAVLIVAMSFFISTIQ